MLSVRSNGRSRRGTCLAVVLALGVQRMAKHHAIVKNLSSVETLGSASVICSDKTGTLTRSEMTIERVMTASGDVHISGVGYAPEGKVEHEGAALVAGPVHDETLAVLSGGSLAGNADLRHAAGGEWDILGDPTEAAFLVSKRKLMTTVERDHENGDALVAITKGAPDLLLDRCTRVRVGLDIVALDAAMRARLLADVDTLTDAALRTLAVAYRPLEAREFAESGDDPAAAEALERELIFVGTVGMIDPPREEAAVAIREAHRAGIRVVMITSDHPKTAARIAADLGIVDALQASGNVVAMTGDGVNDAPALKSADSGTVGTVVLPLLATQLLWINLITDTGPALAMGVDPATDDLMARKPRTLNDRLIDVRMWSSVIQTGVVIAVVTLLTVDFYLPGGLISGTGDLTTARTAGFTVLVFTSLFTCFTARSDTSSAVAGLFANHWLWGAVALSLLLQVAVVHLPVLNIAFGTAQLSLDQWLVCAAMASGVLIYSELRKLVSRMCER